MCGGPDYSVSKRAGACRNIVAPRGEPACGGVVYDVALAAMIKCYRDAPVGLPFNGDNAEMGTISFVDNIDLDLNANSAEKEDK